MPQSKPGRRDKPLFATRGFWMPVAAWLAIVAVGVSLYVGTVFSDRREALDRGSNAALAAAELSAQHAARMFEATDGGLVAVAQALAPYHWDRMVNDRAAWALVREWADRLVSVPRIVLADKAGTIRLHSDVFPAPPRSVAQRAYYETHLMDATDRGVIGAPVVGVVSRANIFTYSRRLTNADGSFAGLAIANMPPETFREFYRALNLPPGSVVALGRSDGLVLVREPMADDPAASRIHYGDILMDGEDWGLGRSVSPADGRERFVAFRRVPGYEAVVMVGLSVDAALAEWRRDTRRSSLILLGAVLGLSGLLVALLVRYHRETAARRDLRASQHRYGLLFEQMLNAVAVHEMIVDDKGVPVDYQFIEVNPAYEAMTGIRRDRIIGRPAGAVFPPREPLRIEEYAAVATTGAPMRFTYRSEWLQRDLEVAAFSPEPGRFACIYNDVTDRQRHEAELRLAMTRLTDQNAELQRFAYVASHDLQEPLRTIVSFTQLLRRRLAGLENPEIKKDMDFVVGAAKRMTALIQDLLVHSRISTRSAAFAPVDMNAACRTAMDNLRDIIERSGAEIDLAPLPGVVGDGVQIAQLIQNLLDNAIKFARPDAPPCITVRCEEVDGEAVFSVADQGIGVEDTDQDIFEIFRRLHPADDAPGTGVGLAVCRKIVRHHHGRIWYEPGTPHGTKFCFTLNPKAAALQDG